MNGSQTTEVEQRRLQVLSERQYAELAAKGGMAVHEHNGRYWRDSNQFGSFLLVPIHWMAELTPEEVGFPRVSTMVTKARVTDVSQHNAFFNLHMIDDPRTYCFETISANTRNKIRKACRDGVEVCLASPELLEEQGYEVVRDSLKKSRYRNPPRKQDYIRSLTHTTFLGGARLVLAGLVPGQGDRQRLGAIATGTAIDGTAYGDDLYVAPWARKSNVGVRLIYAFIEVCQRTPGVDCIVLGRATDDEALDSFKASMGIRRREVPARLAFRGPLVRRAVELLVGARPGLRQRLYGR
jgi:hypothetical protein